MDLHRIFLKWDHRIHYALKPLLFPCTMYQGHYSIPERNRLTLIFLVTVQHFVCGCTITCSAIPLLIGYLIGYFARLF